MVSKLEPFSIEATPYLLSAGFGATVLAIVDPIGRGLKLYVIALESSYIKKKGTKEKILKSWDDIKGAFHTNAIEAEKDRIVSIIYFLIVMAVLSFYIGNDDFFQTHFKILFENDQGCDINCWQTKTQQTIFGISIIVVIVGSWKGFLILKHVRIAATYLNCVNSVNVLESSKENLSTYIKLGDWKTAEIWKEKVESEYISEEAFRKQRDDKLRLHLEQILPKFKEFKEKCKRDNLALLTDSSYFNNIEKTKSLEEIFKEFPHYESLLEHLYTNDNQEIYQLYKEYLELEKKLYKSETDYHKELKNGIEDLINTHLELKHQEKLSNGIRGEKGQWINISLIIREIKRFLEYERTELLPARQVENSPLWEIRFFDSSSLDLPRDDKVALLYKADADRLTVELANYVNKIRETSIYSLDEWKRFFVVEDELEQKVDRMLTMFSLMADPITGSCSYCRNEQFFNKNTIDKHNMKLERPIPEIMSKETIKPKFGKNHSREDALKGSKK